MPRKSKTDQELSWLRNVWEVLAALELQHAGFASVVVKPTAMRSRFYVRFEFARPAAPDGPPPYCGTVTLSYPSSGATEFLPWLWNKSEDFTTYVDNDDPYTAPPQD